MGFYPAMGFILLQASSLQTGRGNARGGVPAHSGEVCGFCGYAAKTTNLSLSASFAWCKQHIPQVKPVEGPIFCKYAFMYPKP